MNNPCKHHSSTTRATFLARKNGICLLICNVCHNPIYMLFENGQTKEITMQEYTQRILNNPWLDFPLINTIGSK